MFFMGKALTTILAVSLLAMVGCSKKPTAPEGTWLRMLPSNCEQTVWEADYSTNSENYTGINQNSELEIMEEYYDHNGINILESDRRPILHDLPGMPPCPDCGCSRGYLITVRVSEKDTLALINDGFSSSLVF